MSLKSLIEQTNKQAYKVGQLKALLKMVIQTVDEKHISPTLLKNIKSQIEYNDET